MDVLRSNASAAEIKQFLSDYENITDNELQHMRDLARANIVKLHGQRDRLRKMGYTKQQILTMTEPKILGWLAYGKFVNQLKTYRACTVVKQQLRTNNTHGGWNK